MTIYLRGKSYDLTDDEINYLKAMFFGEQWKVTKAEKQQRQKDKIIVDSLTAYQTAIKCYW